MGQDLNSLRTSHETAPIAVPPSSPAMRLFLVVDAAFLIMVCIGMLHVVSNSWVTDRLKRRQQAVGFRFRHGFSCYHCRYFGQNPYLKCALHPTTVLTEQSADCRDYAASNLPKDI